MSTLRATLMLGSMMALAAPLAAAQDAANADAPEEEIIVTATKRARNIQDVPISIEVVDQKALEKSGVSDLQTLSLKTPAIQYGTSNGGNLLRVRGVGSDVPAHFEQSVAMYRDGIFMSKSRQNQMPFFDMLRIELLRGPQGALIGKNSSAGAVNFISNNPTDEFEAGLTANYLLDFDGADVFGYMSGPISETLSARVAVKYRNRGGQLKNFATGQDEVAGDTIQGRLTLQFEPSENVRMVTKFEYGHQDMSGHLFFGVPLNAGGYEIARDLILDAGGYSAPPIFLTRPDGVVVGGGNADKQDQYDFSNLLTIDAEGLTFVSLTGFTSYQSEMQSTGRHAAPNETLSTIFYEDFKQVSQEFRIQSDVGGAFEWIVGVYGDYSVLDYVNPIVSALTLPPPAGLSQGGTFTDYEATTSSFSVFGTATWHATEALDVIVGGRYTTVQKSATLENVREFLISGVYTAPAFRYEDSLVDSHFDPSLTIQYKLTPDIMVYATYGQGSKPGTFQSARTTAPGDFRLKQEVTSSYEVGFKSQLSDWLTLNASLYHMTMEDFQVSQYLTDPNGLPVLRATNAATAVSRGGEFQATAHLDNWVEGLRLNASVAYTDAYYDDYPGATCSVPAVALGCVNGQPFMNGERFNGAGLPLQYVPQWTGTASFDYDTAISDTLGIELSGSVNFFSDYFFDLTGYDPVNGLQPADQIYNLRIALTDLDDKWSVAFVGENITDVWRGGQSYLFPGAPGSVRVYGIYGGRNLMLQASVKF